MAALGRTQATRPAPRRKTENGVILVEALVAATVLMTLLAGGFFFHRLYRNKLDTIADARAAAWVDAMRGCSGKNDSVVLGGVLDDSGGGGGDSFPVFGGTIQHSHAAVNRSARNEPLLRNNADGDPGPVRFDVRTDTTVACNEIPSGDVLSSGGPGLLSGPFGKLIPK